MRAEVMMPIWLLVAVLAVAVWWFFFRRKSA